MVANPWRRWREISPALPVWPIRVVGPPRTSGTRDSFTDRVLLAGCQAQPDIRAIADTAQRRRACVTFVHLRQACGSEAGARAAGVPG